MSVTLLEKGYAKINLHLSVRGRRSDGYHLLQMVNVSVALHDMLEITLIPEPDQWQLHLIDEAGAAADRAFEDISQNLAIRAGQAYLHAASINGSCAISLTKRIPLGGGLGGGSADAAAVLRALQRQTGALAADELEKLAISLGADVPYMLCGGLADVSGIGEKITPLECAGLSTVPCILICPGEHLSTASIFQRYASMERHVTPASVGVHSGASRGQMSYRELLALVHNDLEETITQASGSIGQLLSGLRQNRAFHTGVTGTGSTVFVLPDEASSSVSDLQEQVQSQLQPGSDAKLIPTCLQMLPLQIER